MAFQLLKDPMNTQAEYLPISSQTVSVGEVLELDVGATTWTTGDASTEHWQRMAVAIESATSSATEVKAILVNPWQLWQVEGANDADANHNGDRMLLASGGLTVNNTGTDSAAEEAVFIQKGINGTQYCVGYLTGGAGVNSDAA